ncbi:hypothetical protein I6I99_19025 [Sphingobacterium multivorum]|uniref:hypothetical protein n=1 Tax=Sphingobacterium sp. TaxID=341027 RepID=UPI00191916ED|nr:MULTISPECIES: hypothetical protein [Sphingobacterium]QQT29424.1 hypothetical protein I6I99_19025 [Sphingobacterium multivorum]
MSKKHVGEILDNIATNHPLPKVELIRLAGYGSQSTYYKHISRNDLPFRVLYKYAKVMDYNFAKEIPEFSEWIESKNLPKIGASSIEESKLIKEKDSWKEKYFELLEKYNKLLEEQRRR